MRTMVETAGGVDGAPASLEPPRSAVDDFRRTEAQIDRQFIERWSRRAFTSEPLTREELASVFEAARWAPSAANAQPWLFIYADTEPELARFRPLLRSSNRRWAERAPVLAFIFAKRHHGDGSVNRTAQFDTGAAWMSLALQARTLGLVVRAMGGIYPELVYGELGVPESEYEVMCGLAIGHEGEPESLPPELQPKERPNTRRPLSEVALAGRFVAG